MQISSGYCESFSKTVSLAYIQGDPGELGLVVFYTDFKEMNMNQSGEFKPIKPQAYCLVDGEVCYCVTTVDYSVNPVKRRPPGSKGLKSMTIHAPCLSKMKAHGTIHSAVSTLPSS